MFKKVLIANRGEIAVRVIRACRELGVRTVAVYSEADRESLHVKIADESVCIGPAKSAESYLAIPRLLAAADITKADAIHPGYGFLSEKAQFAEAVESSGITFIGPTPEAIRLMGDKSVAKSTMKAAKVPTLPGSEGILESVPHALEIAEQVGYPVILKARDGGGGKGMRVVRSGAELERALPMAQAEAMAAFSSDAMYLEKFLERPRHIEIQLAADIFGNVVHLCERDCSVQRRHQKLIEEAPGPGLDPVIRTKMGEAACRGAKQIGYRGLGTMEFLHDADGSYYFMEMNTRLQVEHPVTEMILSLDLVKLQIRLAAGEPLPFGQEEVIPRGHAIECRINAESPRQNFRPSPGKIESLHFAGGPGIRLDTHIYSGYSIPPFYDSMIAKLIAYGATREEAIDRMLRALDESRIEGIDTTMEFQAEVLRHPGFRRGGVDTHFLEEMRSEAAPPTPPAGSAPGGAESPPPPPAG
ncbi:MAG: acetyl-CoA carboxylase biotin carboxylase subunit [Candidatus Eisenbacteria bacterium]|nr:acetyl-CoA carboxylase biotin carboxylase subunit [Candidatus Eisenbacteria bacterium]